MSTAVSTNPTLAVICERIAIANCVIIGLMVVSLLALPSVHFTVPVMTVQMLALLTLCILHAAATKGWRKALGFSVISFVISWFVEYIGCNYSLWFGDYEYTEKLGFAVGNVPLLVVAAWEVIIYPSLLIVDELLGSSAASNNRGHWFVKGAFASLATALVATAWDMLTDPLAVHEGFWTWDHGGAYLPDIDNGMPFGNFWGWIGAVFIISFLYRLLFTRADQPVKQDGSTLLFATSLYTSLFFSMVYGLHYFELYQPMFIGTFTMGPVILLAWSKLLVKPAQPAL